MVKKVCPKCKGSEPQVQFAQNLSKKDGKAVCCKECQRAYNRDHYANNKAYYVAKAEVRNDEQSARLKLIIDEAKDRPCIDCGRKFHPCAMDFDHVRGVKESSIAHMRSHKVSEDRLRAEMAKCEVRCAVCHRLRTHGIAPVQKELAQPSEG